MSSLGNQGRSREIKGDRTWSASDGRMRRGQVEKYEASNA